MNPKMLTLWEKVKDSCEPARMSPEDRKQFVLDVLANRIFSSAHLRKGDDIGMVFFPLACGGIGPSLPKLEPPPETCPEEVSLDEREEQLERLEQLNEHNEWLNTKIREHYFQHLGGLYEHYDKALPRGINGLPFFMSVRVMHIEDWNMVNEVIVAEQERLADLVV